MAVWKTGVGMPAWISHRLHGKPPVREAEHCQSCGRKTVLHSRRASALATDADVPCEGPFRVALSPQPDSERNER